MTPPNHPERTFARRLASHALATALGAAVGSLLSFYQGQRSYAQEECVRRGMDARFVEDFPQYRESKEQKLIRLYDDRMQLILGDVLASYLTGKVIAAESALEQRPLLQQAAERGRRTELALQQECAENSRRYP